MSETIPDINGYKNRLEVIQQVAEQIEKDLNLDGPLTLSGDPDLAYGELETQLLPWVKYHLYKDLTHLLNTLYRIDVSEKKLRSALHTPTNQPEEQVYTQLIIERELQKVVIRLWYSKSLEE